MSQGMPPEGMPPEGMPPQEAIGQMDPNAGAAAPQPM